MENKNKNSFAARAVAMADKKENRQLTKKKKKKISIKFECLQDIVKIAKTINNIYLENKTILMKQ